jgi:hypothetical protein
MTLLTNIHCQLETAARIAVIPLFYGMLLKVTIESEKVIAIIAFYQCSKKFLLFK